MEKSIFNIHDLVLLLTAFECLAIAMFFYRSPRFRTLPVVLLFSFFLVRVAVSSHELILWGSTFRHLVLDFSPNLFFALNFSYCLDAPLIYLYCQSVLNPDFKLQRKHLAHLLPALLFIGFLSATFYVLPVADKYEQIKDFSFADLNFVAVDFLIKLVRVVYLGLAVVMVRQAIKKAEDTVTQTSDALVLFWLVSGFFGILMWELVLSSVKIYNSLFSIDDYPFFAKTIGITDYYLLFILVNAFIYLSINKLNLDKKVAAKSARKNPVNMECVKKLEAAMDQEKLYLNHNLSAERLAELLEISVKDLSHTINCHYKINFYEFINNYRVEEARRLLSDTKYSDRSITDIFFDAGFNSKSVYNTLFKKKYNQTPSQYRKKSAANKSPDMKSCQQ